MPKSLSVNDSPNGEPRAASRASQGVRAIPERGAEGLTARAFHEEIVAAAEPVVLRGLVASWPVVAAARQSPDALATYLDRFDRGLTMRAMIAPPAAGGRFFYNDEMSGFNFRTESLRLKAALELLLAANERPASPAIAIQSVKIPENLSGFERENRMELLPESAEPRIWIGNRVVVAAHHDPSENIACVVAGKRRFTLFPPEQVANLYPGPFELTPAGPTISMVDFDSPDRGRFPRFAQAESAALTADLEPGDALYIPYLWWHQVRSTEALNVLVNYWWSHPSSATGHPMEALLHAMLSIRALPQSYRNAWSALFDHYVFEGGDVGAHLPAERQGVQAKAPTQETIQRVRAQLAKSLASR